MTKDANGASHRVHRGGGWPYDSSVLPGGVPRATRRRTRHSHLGLRLARVPVGKETVALPPPREERKPEDRRPT